MTNADAAAIGASRRDWVSEHRAAYLRSGGAEGHILDLVAVGGLPFSSHCLIRYRGRKTGRTLITGLCHGIIGGEAVICASKGGADTHPTWYLNILASETIDFQIATQAWRATWREPEGAERAKVWAYMVDCFPFYASYQKSTTRILPLVMMKAIEAIPVFSAADAEGARQY